MAKSLRRILFLWHRRVGVFSALIVLLLSISGLLLNHSDALGLPALGVNSRVILSMYNIDTPAPRAFRHGDGFVLQIENQLFYNQHSLASCESTLVGVASHSGLNYLACRHELLLFTDDWQLVEKLGPAFGLPVPVDALGVLDKKLALRSQQQVFIADAELEWSPQDRGIASWSAQVAVPAGFAEQLKMAHKSSDISWERVVLDFHAGRFLGRLGPFVMDIFALLFIALAVSGCWMWLRTKRSR